MPGLISVGNLSASGDLTTAANIRNSSTQSQRAVDERIGVRVPQEIANDPSLISVAEAAVSNAVTGLNLLEATRGQLPNGTNLNDCRGAAFAGAWQITSSNTHLNSPSSPTGAVVFTVESGNANNAVRQVWTEVRSGELVEYTRKLINPTGDGGNPAWSKWMQTQYATTPASARAIIELAARDGWRNVYDPTNLATVRRDGSGDIIGLSDGLNFGPELTTNAGRGPSYLPNEYGQLAGMGFDGNEFLRASFANPVTGRLCIMVIGRWDGSETETGFSTLLDGASGIRKNIIVRSSAEGMPYSTAAHEGTEYKADKSPHLFRLLTYLNHEELSVDGQYASVRTDISDGLGGIILGATPAIANLWEGSIGAVLVYNGVPHQQKIDRMEKLIFSLMGREKGPHILRPTTTAFSRTSSGRETLVHGDVDMVWPTGIQSITKLMTILTARTVISQSEFNSLTSSYQAGDDSGTGIWQVGDTMTLYNWAWASIGPSFNASNEVIARFAGGRMSGPGTPRERFMREMNRLSKLWFGGEYFTNPSFAATLSARQTIDLMERGFGDPMLAALMATASRTVSITGPNPRSYTWGHTIPSNAGYPFGSWRGGKTGGGQGDGFVVTAWENALDGEIHYTAIMNTPTVETDHRYVELKKVMVATLTSGHNHALTPSTQPKRGDGLSVTGGLDVTDLFGATKVGSDSSVWLERQGDWVKLSFQGVRMPADASLSNVLPVTFRPKTFEYATLMADSTTPRELRITSSGTVNIQGNTSSEVLRGTAFWRTRREWPLELP